MPDLPALYHPRVSRHAIERFRERVYDASDATITAHILAAGRPWIAAGAETITSGGLSIRARGGVVLTVLPSGAKSYCRRAGHKGHRHG